MNRRVFLPAAALGALLSTAARADVVISTDPTQNMSCSGGVCSPTDHEAILNISELSNMLANSNVTVTSHIFKNRYAGDIDLVAPLSWTSASKLTLTSNGRVQIEAPISVLGQGGLVITNQAIFAKGAAVTFWDLGSLLSITNVTYVLFADFPALVSDIAANPKGAYALADDYDAAGDQFRKAPIPAFGGVLLGLGHSISNLIIPKGRKLCEGMVSTNTGSIRNIALNNVSIKLDPRSRYVGGIAGCNNGSLSAVTVSGQVVGSADSSAGGIAGSSSAGIGGARSLATVTGGQAGGIAGENDSGINQASAGGVVNGSINTGGLAGLNNGSIDTSYATGNVTGSENNTGGLVGSNHGSISNSYAMGSVVGGPGAAGGLAGFNGGLMSFAYSTGQVTGGAGYTGGFVGYDPNEGIASSYWDTDSSGISDPAQGAGLPQYRSWHHRVGDGRIEGALAFRL
ncbi:MAG: ZmpA/ZmpB/ZmpC family metallo-endopeptidase-related protein [Alphaproteobacteria bacterium]